MAVAPTTGQQPPSEVARVLCDLAALGYEGIAAAAGVVRQHTDLGMPELAIQVGLPPAALRLWEQGRFIPRTHHLLRLATILATHPNATTHRLILPDSLPPSPASPLTRSTHP